MRGAARLTQSSVSVGGENNAMVQAQSPVGCSHLVAFYFSLFLTFPFNFFLTLTGGSKGDTLMLHQSLPYREQD